MPSNSPQLLRDEFARRFGRPGAVVARAPGRVNLIGEHTDYNEGYVLPMALEQNTWVAAAPRDDGLLQVQADDLHERQAWPLTAWDPERLPGWTGYVAGVALLLHRRGFPLRGADMLIRSDVPVGGGLSSSAALEVSAALALGALGAQTPAGTDLADLCRAAEHEFAKVPCGIMDQYVSVLARKDCALLLDCRSRTWEHIPLRLGDHVIVVVNSGVKHALASSEYAARQAQGQQAVEFFRRADPSCRSLRDVDSSTVRTCRERMDPLAAARALHVATENERTLAAAVALRRGDLAELGKLLYASHRSLRDDYQVSSPELDLLVEIVGAVPGVAGARLTGGGFGGCIIAVAHRDRVPAVQAAVREKYDNAGHGPSHLMVTQAGPGAGVEP